MNDTSSSPGLTPIRVRGKRSALPCEKRRKGRNGASIQPRRTKAISVPSTASLSQLEQLPTEMIEIIFLASRNPNLPLVSRTLLQQLSSKHLATVMIDHLLSRLFLHSNAARKVANDPSLWDDQALLDRRCFTFNKLCSWLDRAPEPRLTPRQYAAYRELSPENGRAGIHAIRCDRMNDKLPISRLRLPQRIFTPPWSEDRLALLQFYQRVWVSPADQDYLDRARDALSPAISEGNVEVLQTLIAFPGIVDGLNDTLFQHAVIDCGCSFPIVELALSQFHLHNRHGGLSPPLHFDALNADIWQWADKSAQVRSGAGAKLKALLRDYLRKIESSKP